MSDDPFAPDEVPPASKSLVRVTLKGESGYDAPWITVDGETPEDVLAKFDDSLVELMKKASDAAASFKRFWHVARDGNVPAPGQAGKPAGASTAAATELPFQESGVNGQAALDVPTCGHGQRTLVEYKGQSGWVCKLPKGDPNRCPSVPA